MAQPDPGPDAGHRHHTAEDVRHRQEEQHRRLLARPRLEDRVEEFDGVVDLGEEVAVRQRAALGTARRARGVDQRRQRVRREHAPPYADLPVRLLGAQLGQALHMALLHHPHVAQVGQPVQFGTEGGRLGAGLRDQGHRTGVLEDPAGLEDRGGGVDGYRHQAGRPRGEVEECPLVPGARHDGDPVSRRQALGDQPLGHRLHLVGELRRRHVRPPPVLALAAEDHRAGGRTRVVEGQVPERPAGHRRRERRYVRLPYRPVQPPRLGLHQGRPGSVVERGRGGEGGKRGGHGRLLRRACSDETACCMTYVPRAPWRSPAEACGKGYRWLGRRSYGARVWVLCGFGGVPGPGMCNTGGCVRGAQLPSAFSWSRSRTAVTPCPPAAQTEISPRPGPPFSASSSASVATIRAPVAAKG